MMAELVEVTRSQKRVNNTKEQVERYFEIMSLCRTVSETKIISYLYDNGPSSRNDIMSAGLKRTTAHDTLTRLHVKNLVKREIVKKGRGRPVVHWSIAS